MSAPAPTKCSECGVSLPARPPGKPGSPRSICSSSECNKERNHRHAREKFARAVAAHGGTPEKLCPSCGRHEPLRPGSWVFSHGHPTGSLCLRCSEGRAKELMLRRPAPTGDVAAKHEATRRTKRRNSPAGKLLRLERLARSTRPIGDHADAAVRLGARVLNSAAAKTTKEFKAAIDDPDHPGHVAAMELAVSRILPMKSINAAAMRLARSDSAEARVPEFTLNIGLTEGPGK